MNVTTHTTKQEAPSQSERNKLIDSYTAQVIAAVPEIIPYAPLTLCIIDDEFVCVTTYDISDELATKLEVAAKGID